jgi:hypothetical protein
LCTRGGPNAFRNPSGGCIDRVSEMPERLIV